MSVREMSRFRRDPLGFVEDFARRSPTDVFRLPWGAWCVRDTDLAMTVLRDPVFNSGMAGFFGDMLPSRDTQIGVGRAVRNTVRDYLPAYREAMARAVAELPVVSAWPRTGLELVQRATASLLLYPAAAPTLRRLQERNVQIGMMRSPHMRNRVRAEMLRPKRRAAAIEHVAQRRAEGIPPGPPRDVLDAVLGACPSEVTDQGAASAYLLLARSIVGTVGYAVAWALLQACVHHRPGSSWPWPTDWMAREAARHRPVVWMVGRRVPQTAEYGGTAFQPGTVLSVSPYLLHHDQQHWSKPGEFRPERWGEAGEHGPYLPFSAGPFTCAGAAVAHTLITEALTALTNGSRLSVHRATMRPHVTDSAVPRAFELQRDPTR
ncbi:MULTISPECIES: cytochrome P450 [Streptomyces]|uniref:cytochrome P450 n=1 Tax=Streptomyces TaxID=1883 RepID=UPI0027E3EE14|nr:cytochrome P450 [Streptomyces sp. McG3]